MRADTIREDHHHLRPGRSPQADQQVTPADKHWLDLLARHPEFEQFL